MFSFTLIFMLTAFAIAHASLMIAESDAFEWFRLKAGLVHAWVGELVSCKYCISMWLCGFAGVMSTIYAWGLIGGSVPMPFQLLITWFSMHFVVCFLHNKYTKMMNDAPIPLYVLHSEASGNGEGGGEGAN